MKEQRDKGAIVRQVVVQGWFHEFDPPKRDKRKKYADPIVFEMEKPDKGRRWLLGYYTNRKKGTIYGWTGPFKTKAEAIKWYNGGGR